MLWLNTKAGELPTTALIREASTSKRARFAARIEGRWPFMPPEPSQLGPRRSATRSRSFLPCAARTAEIRPSQLHRNCHADVCWPSLAWKTVCPSKRWGSQQNRSDHSVSIAQVATPGCCTSLPDCLILFPHEEPYPCGNGTLPFLSHPSLDHSWWLNQPRPVTFPEKRHIIDEALLFL